jgi:hypothetical protein
MRLFIPLERNVLHIRDTHIRIDHDTLTIIIIIAIPNQRSVKNAFAERKKKRTKKNQPIHNNNRTGFRLLGLHMIVPTRAAVMRRLIESMVVVILQMGVFVIQTAVNIVRFEGRKDLIGRHELLRTLQSILIHQSNVFSYRMNNTNTTNTRMKSNKPIRRALYVFKSFHRIVS